MALPYSSLGTISLTIFLFSISLSFFLVFSLSFHLSYLSLSLSYILHRSSILTISYVYCNGGNNNNINTISNIILINFNLKKMICLNKFLLNKLILTLSRPTFCHIVGDAHCAERHSRESQSSFSRDSSLLNYLPSFLP